MFRPPGLGYANLGALIMSLGKPYDSDEGRAFAGAVTALLTGYAYTASAEIAATRGPFEEYAKNSASMLAVLGMHRDGLSRVKHDQWISTLTREAHQAWDHAIEAGQRFGFRNAQVTVLAPTGTIGFMMDCDTTGVEPDIALVKYKQMADGGLFKIINQTLPIALKRLGYTHEQIAAMLAHVNEHDTIEEAPGLSPEHLKVFDCAFKPKKGTRFIDYHAHLKMMAAVQPFISGAISKTVNMPNEATVEEIERVYMEGWKMGLKAIAIYRDGSKRQQALTTSKEKDSAKSNAEDKAAADEKQTEVPTVKVAPVAENVNAPRRRRLPDERRALTHRFMVGGHKGFITVGLYDDGTPGEVFITMAKEGSVISGLMDAFATSISIGLQYGVPLQVLVDKFVHVRFEPSGFTNNPNIRIAKSIVDYIFRWLALKFLSPQEQLAVGVNNVTVGESQQVELPKAEEKPVMVAPVSQSDLFDAKSEKVSLTSTFNNTADAPACDTCGSMMVRNASCYKCLNCGSSSGCS